MEVVGIVAAIPGLIQLVAGTKAIVVGLVSNKALSKELKSLTDELDWIEKMLRDALGRHKARTSLDKKDLDRLRDAMNDLKDDLTTLNTLLKSTNLFKNGSKFFSRAKAVMSGIDKKLNQYRQRLEKSRSTLMLIILGHNEAMIAESLSISRDNVRLELHKILRPCDHSFIPPSLSGTSEWIWKHPTFLKWIQKPCAGPDARRDQVMCMYGTKGTGKSVLSASIVDRFKAQGRIVTLFSFWSGSESQRKLIDLLRTFLWLLMREISDEDLAKVSVPLMANLPTNEENLTNSIKKCLEIISSPVYCIIDGIDESAEDWSTPKSTCLPLVNRLAKEHPNLQLLLSGREPSIRTILAANHLRLEITEDLVRQDMDVLISSELDRSLRIQTPEIRELVATYLQENSKIMFLWVSLIFKELNRCHLQDEIRRTLDSVPRDLDREYHRLLDRLSERLGGSSVRPSISMQRAKRLLSIILAAPEPLTRDELRWAFAVSEHPYQGFEEYVISDDGIIDACGDFVRFSGGRYHIAHASAAEFLTRDIDLWQFEDQDISFFRIDKLEAQRQMCFACLDYLDLVNLGYPMTDDNAFSVLPVKLPLLLYSSRYLPFHLMQVYSSLSDCLIDQRLEKLLDSSQLCVLLEFLFLAVSQDAWTLTYHYMEFIQFVFEPSSVNMADRIKLKILNIPGIMGKELGRRQGEFEVGDARYSSWKAIIQYLGILCDNEPSLITENQAQIAKPTSLPLLAAGPLAHVPKHIVSGHQSTRRILDLRKTFQTSIMKNTAIALSDVAVAPAKLLPFPVLILWAFMLPESEWRTKIKIVSMALAKVRHKRKFSECLCLQWLGEIYIANDYNLERAEELVRQALEIALTLGRSLHNEVMIGNCLRILMEMLFESGREAEAQAFAEQFETRLAVEPEANKIGSIWQEHFFGKRFWAELQVLQRRVLADTQYDYRHYEDALRVIEPAITLLERNGVSIFMRSFDVRTPDWFALKVDALWKLGRYKEMENAGRSTLKHCKEADQGDVYADLALSLLMQSRESEALQEISEHQLGSPATVSTLSSLGLRSLIKVWLSLGKFDEAEYCLSRKCTAAELEISLDCALKSQHLNVLAETLATYRPSMVMRNTIYHTLTLLEACSGRAGLVDDIGYWIGATSDEVYSSSDQVWDVSHLKVIDLELASDRPGGLSRADAELSYLAQAYCMKGLWEAAAVVLEHVASQYMHSTSLFDHYHLRWLLDVLSWERFCQGRYNHALRLGRASYHLENITYVLPDMGDLNNYRGCRYYRWSQYAATRGQMEEAKTFLEESMRHYEEAWDKAADEDDDVEFVDHIKGRLEEVLTFAEKIRVQLCSDDSRSAFSSSTTSTVTERPGLRRPRSLPELRTIQTPKHVDG